MPDLTAKRTLVKSPPELWEELSEVERLAKHLGAFGEITITKLEPEHTVAWEGEHASGTVSIEPSGWGTKVTLRAELPETEEAEPAEPEPEAPADAAEPEPERRTEPRPTAWPGAEAAGAGASAPRPWAEPDPVAEREVDAGAETPEPKHRGAASGAGCSGAGRQPVEREPKPVAAEPVAAEPEPSRPALIGARHRRAGADRSGAGAGRRSPSPPSPSRSPSPPSPSRSPARRSPSRTSPLLRRPTWTPTRSTTPLRSIRSGFA